MALFDTILNALGGRRQTNNRQQNNTRDRNTTGSTVQAQASQQAKSTNRQQQQRNVGQPRIEQRPQRSFSVNTPSYNQKPQNTQRQYNSNDAYKLVTDVLGDQKKTVQESAEEPVTANNISEKMFGRTSAMKALSDVVTNKPTDLSQYDADTIQNAKDLYSAREQHMLDMLHIDPNSEQGRALIAKGRQGDKEGDNWEQYLPRETDQDILIRTARDVGLGATQVKNSMQGLADFAEDATHWALTGDTTPQIDERDRRMHEFNQMSQMNARQRTEQDWYDDIVMNLTSNLIRNQITGGIIGNMGLVGTRPGKALGLGALGGSSFGSAYGDMRYDDGASLGSAALYGLASAGSELAQEALPGGKIAGAERFNLNLNDAIGEFNQEAFGAFLDPFVETFRTHSPVDDYEAWQKALADVDRSYYTDENGNFSWGQVGKQFGRVAKEGGLAGLSSFAGGAASYASDTARQFATDRQVRALSKDLAKAVKEIEALQQNNAPQQQAPQAQQAPVQMPQLDLSGAMARDADEYILSYPEQSVEDAEMDRREALDVRAPHTTNEINREYIQKSGFDREGKLKTAFDAYVNDMFGGNVNDDTAIGNGATESLKTMRKVLGDGGLMTTNKNDLRNAQIANEYVIRASAERHGVDISDDLLNKITAISNRIGVPVEFLPSEVFDQYHADGWFSRGPANHGLRTGVIQLRADSTDAVDDLVSTFLHEVMHTTEGTPEYFNLKRALMAVDDANYNKAGEYIGKDVGFGEKIATDDRRRQGTEHFANLVGNFVDNIYQSEKSDTDREEYAEGILDILGKPGEDFDPLEFVKSVYDNVIKRNSVSKRDKAINTVKKYLGRAMDASRYANEYQRLLYDNNGYIQLERAINAVAKGEIKSLSEYGYKDRNGKPMSVKEAKRIIRENDDIPYNGVTEYETPFDWTRVGSAEDDYKRYMSGDEQTGWVGNVVPRGKAGNPRQNVKQDRELNTTKLFTKYAAENANDLDMKEANKRLNAKTVAEKTNGIYTEEQIKGYLKETDRNKMLADLPGVIKGFYPNLTDKEANAVASQLIKSGRITEKQAQSINESLDWKRLNEVATAIKTFGKEQDKALKQVAKANSKTEESNVELNPLGLTDAEMSRIADAVAKNGGKVNRDFVKKMAGEFGLTKISKASNNQILNIYRAMNGMEQTEETKRANPRLTNPDAIQFPQQDAVFQSALDAQLEIKKRKKERFRIKDFRNITSREDAEKVFRKLQNRANKRDFYELRDARSEIAYRVRGKNKGEVVDESKNRFVINKRTNVFTGTTVNDLYQAVLEDYRDIRDDVKTLQGMVEIRLGLEPVQISKIVRAIGANGGEANAKIMRDLMESGIPLGDFSVSDIQRLYNYMEKVGAYGKEINIGGEKFEKGELDKAYRFAIDELAHLTSLKNDLRGSAKKRDEALSRMGFEPVNLAKNFLASGVIDETYTRYDDALEELYKIEADDTLTDKQKRRASANVLRKRDDDAQFPHNEDKEDIFLDQNEVAERAKKEAEDEALEKDFYGNLPEFKQKAEEQANKKKESLNRIKETVGKAADKAAEKATEEDKELQKIAEQAVEEGEKEQLINWKANDYQRLMHQILQEYGEETQEHVLFDPNSLEVYDRRDGRIYQRKDGSQPDKDIPEFKENWLDKQKPNKLADRGVDFDTMSRMGKEIQELRKSSREALEESYKAWRNNGPKLEEWEPQGDNVEAVDGHGSGNKAWRIKRDNVLLRNVASVYSNFEDNETRLSKIAQSLKNIYGVAEDTAQALAKNLTDTKAKADTALFVKAAKEMANRESSTHDAKWYAHALGDAKSKFFKEVQNIKNERKEKAEFAEKAQANLEKAIKNYKDNQKKKDVQKAKADAQREENNQEAIAWGEKRRAKEEAEQQEAPVVEEEVKEEAKPKAEKKKPTPKKTEAKTETKAETKTETKAEAKTEEKVEKKVKVKKVQKEVADPASDTILNTVKSSMENASDAVKAALDEALEINETNDDDFNSTYAQTLFRLGADTADANKLAEQVIKTTHGDNNVMTRIRNQIANHTGLSKQDAKTLMASVRTTYRHSVRDALEQRTANAKIDKSKKTEQTAEQKEEAKKTKRKQKAKETVKKVSETAKAVKGKDFTEAEKQVIQETAEKAEEKKEAKIEKTRAKAEEHVNKKVEEQTKNKAKELSDSLYDKYVSFGMYNAARNRFKELGLDFDFAEELTEKIANVTLKAKDISNEIDKAAKLIGKNGQYSEDEVRTALADMADNYSAEFERREALKEEQFQQKKNAQKAQQQSTTANAKKVTKEQTAKKPRPKVEQKKTEGQTKEQSLYDKYLSDKKKAAEQIKSEPKEQSLYEKYLSDKKKAQQQTNKQNEDIGEKRKEDIRNDARKRANKSEDFSEHQTASKQLKDEDIDEGIRARIDESLKYKNIKHDEDVKEAADTWIKDGGLGTAFAYAEAIASDTNPAVTEEELVYLQKGAELGNKLAKDIRTEIARLGKEKGDHRTAISHLRDEQKRVVDQTVTVVEAMYNAASESGRALRAMRFMYNNPELAPAYFRRQIEKLNKQYKVQLEKEHRQITLNEKLVAQYMEAKTDEERDKIWEKIEDDAAEQIPRSAAEMYKQWRVYCMLSNPRTHLRNLASNWLTGRLFRVDDQVQAGIESLLTGNKEINKAANKAFKSLTGQEFTQDDRQASFGAIDEIFLDAAEWLDTERHYSKETNGSKFNVMGARRKVGAFHNTNWFGRMLNGANRINMGALEWADKMAVQARAQITMAQILKARGYTVTKTKSGYEIKRGNNVITDRELSKMENAALKSAQEATFHDVNKVASLIESAKKKLGPIGFALDVADPFAKTSANILGMAIQHSPAQLLASISTDLNAVNKGEMTATTYVTRLSRGLTGTALCALGALLANMGILTKPKDEDEEGRTSYYDTNIFGKQPLALHPPGSNRYYSIDWGMPSTSALMMGAQIAYTATKYHGANVLEGDTLQSILKDGVATLNPVLEASYLTSLREVLEGISEGDWDDAFVNGLSSLAQSLVGQSLPTHWGAFNRMIDPVKRTTSGNSFEERVKNRALMNLPFQSTKLQPAIDEKGNEMENIGALVGNNWAGRGIYYFLSPVTITEDTHDELDSELMKVGMVALPRNQTGTGGLKGQIWSDIDKLRENGVDISMKDISGETYTNIKKTYYGNLRQYVKDYNELAEYNRLGTHARDDVYKKLEKLALAEAKATYYDDKVGSTDDLYEAEQKAAIALKKYGVSPSQFFLMKDCGLTGNKRALYVMSELENLGVADEVVQDVLDGKYFASAVGLTDSVILKTAEERERARADYLVDDKNVSLESQVAAYRKLSNEEYKGKSEKDKEESKEESRKEFLDKYDKKYGTNYGDGSTNKKSKGKGSSGSKRRSSGRSSSSRGSSSSEITTDELKLYENFLKDAGKALKVKGKLPSASIDYSFVDDSKLWDKLVNGNKSAVEKLRRELGIK